MFGQDAPASRGDDSTDAVPIAQSPAPLRLKAHPLTLLHVLARLGENGLAREVVRCVRLCRDSWTNAQLWERVIDLQHVDAEAPDAGLTTRLIHWSTVDDETRVSETLDRGADVNRVDSRGFSALHWAREGGHEDVCTELLRHGAVEDAADGLAQAASDGDMDSVANLVARGADIDARDDLKLTPFFHACRRGDAATAAALLRLGADVNAHRPSGASALFVAAAEGFAETIRVLLAAPGVALNAAAGRHGVTALQMARQRGHATVVALLEAAGAR